MLVPAILYKEEITKEFCKIFYTEDMLLECGDLTNGYPTIPDVQNAGDFDFAIVDDNNKLIGYLGYTIDYYSSRAYNFGLLSFDRGNMLIGKELFNKLEELVATLHRVDWKMVSGNPAERSYDKFCNKYNGNKHILKDYIKDSKGNYRDYIIYEIIKEE